MRCEIGNEMFDSPKMIIYFLKFTYSQRKGNGVIQML